MASKLAKATFSSQSDRANSASPELIPYEKRLSADLKFAMGEGSGHFEGKSAVQKALHKIAKRLEDLGIEYAVAGGMALFIHGVRRFTEDVNILVTSQGLKEIHKHLDSLGYVPPFKQSKNLRDVECGVKIEFLISGQFPGDGKPKQVAFPDPHSAATDGVDGIKYLKLESLIELKLASGMTNPLRGKDLIDVQELIQLLKLPKEFVAHLNPFVQEKFTAIWTLVNDPDIAKKYGPEDESDETGATDLPK